MSIAHWQKTSKVITAVDIYLTLLSVRAPTVAEESAAACNVTGVTGTLEIGFEDIGFVGTGGAGGSDDGISAGAAWGAGTGTGVGLSGVGDAGSDFGADEVLVPSAK